MGIRIIMMQRNICIHRMGTRTQNRMGTGDDNRMGMGMTTEWEWGHKDSNRHGKNNIVTSNDSKYTYKLVHVHVHVRLP